jgi:predicted glycoside hydrolase/deacetylase ChbG (UPF0249 family)
VLIVNADDWGRSTVDTDATSALYEQGLVTSVSAMVFMADSVRAARCAERLAICDVGLHLNFSERFDGPGLSAAVRSSQEPLIRFFETHRYAPLVYNPMLRRTFQESVRIQLEEFVRVYGRFPEHFDGHRHHHLCMNMVLGELLPVGAKVRRSFTFSRADKSALNLTYRKWVDRRLSRRYVLADHFFSIEPFVSQRDALAARVASLAAHATVEVMIHPRRTAEYEYLRSPECQVALEHVVTGTHADLMAQ